MRRRMDTSGGRRHVPHARFACPGVSIRARPVDEGGKLRDARRMSAMTRVTATVATKATGRKTDEHVVRALVAMTEDPARSWTVAALARVAGLSRAPFARRFRRATGTSPRRWLTVHRLELAQARLAAVDAGDATLSAIATSIGYASEFAFSKAFKRVFGVAPALFRRIAAARHVPAVTPSPRFRAAA